MFNDPSGLNMKRRIFVLIILSIITIPPLTRKRESGLHYHDSLEINHVQGAEGVAYVEGRSLDLSELGVLILPPRTVHSYRIKGNGGHIRVWHLGADCFHLLNTVELISLFSAFRSTESS